MGNEFLSPNIGSVAIAILAVWFALGYLLAHTESPKGLVFVRDAFFALFFVKIFGYMYDFINLGIWSFIDVMGHVFVAALLIVGALQIKKITVNKNKIITLSLSISGLIAFFVAFVGNVPLFRFFHYGIIGVGFAMLSFVFFMLRQTKRREGFVFSSVILALLSLLYLVRITFIGGTIDSFSVIEPALCVALAFGLVFISNNLLCIQLDSMQEQIDAGRSRLEQIVLSSPFPIMISKLKDDHLLLINEKAANLFNVDIYSSYKYRTVDFYVDPNNRNELISLLEKNPVVENFEILVRAKGMTESFWLLVSARVIDYNYEIAIYMAFQDITERKQKELRLYDQATRDPLTGCYNRRSFDEMVVKEVYKARRTKRPFCVFMIDADHFKKVNDTYGHGAGDRVLKALAACCRRTLRESDIISRFGGEEFVVFMPDTKIEMAFKVCDRLRINISELIVNGDNKEEIKFTVSMGLVESSEDDDLNMENLLKISDDALYIAKKSGRNRVIIGEKGQDVNIASEALEVKPLVQMVKAEKDNVPLAKEVGVIKPTLEEMAEKEPEYKEPPLPDDDYKMGSEVKDVLFSKTKDEEK